MPDKTFTCHDYIGVTCVNGNCPNACALDDPFTDYYPDPNRVDCRACLSNRGCEDCGYPDLIDTTREECRRRHDWRDGS